MASQADGQRVECRDKTSVSNQELSHTDAHTHSNLYVGLLNVQFVGKTGVRRVVWVYV